MANRRYHIMGTYFNQIVEGFIRAMPDFRLLQVGTHNVDPRAAASIPIVAMTLGLAIMLSMSLGEPVRVSASRSTDKVAPPPAADKVTIVAAPDKAGAEKPSVPCADQTWPYIDRRCLTESTQKRPVPEASKNAVAAPVAPIDPRALATAPVVPAPNVAAVNPVPPAPSAMPAEPQRRAAPDTPYSDDVIRRGAPYWGRDGVPAEQDQAELDDEDYEPVPPPRDYRRDERRRMADPGQRMQRRWREFIHEFPVRVPRGFY